MRNLLRSRRGSAAFATVIALVPLIGVVALGGEAGSWYVTRQHAQNAADAAAYSGALRLACTLGATTCTDTDSVDYRGKEFAAQNTFCNAGDSTTYPGRQCAASLPTGVSQAVAIDIGDYRGGTFTTPPAGSGNAVRAQVSQQQPAYLAAILGLTTVNIPAQAIAQVQQFATPCVLALAGPISFQDSAVTLNAPNCGVASNATPNGFDFKANPTVKAGSLSTSGGCSGSATYCGSVQTFAAPVTDPFSVLNTAMNTPSALTLPKCGGSGLTAYTASTPCANNNFSANKATAIPASGVYFFSGTLKLTGTGSITTSGGIKATIILLPGASLSMVGGTSITITGQPSVPTTELPARLQSDANLLADMAIYDTESGTPKINGGASITGNGVLYFPNATLDFQGNPTATTCQELIAASIEFSGTPNFNNTGCPNQIIPKRQVVALVQ
jgi:Flp pilus assembly protein TadG